MWTKDKLAVAYDDDLLKWQLGADHPTNPVRAKLAVAALQKLGIDMHVMPIDYEQDVVPELLRIHKPGYIEQVRAGFSREWDGCEPQLGATAEHMFAGTVQLVRAVDAGQVQVAFSPQGAKHHAMWDRSSGFCVYNDMAWAANHFADKGMRVVYIDLDAHHGDGVESLTLGTAGVMTLSIHDGTIFPSPRSGLNSLPEKSAYNWPLKARAGDLDWLSCLRTALKLAAEFDPHVVLVAIGADAHETDPLSTLKITYDAYAEAAGMIGDFAGRRNLPVICGGAGGYQPLSHTPIVWATFVASLWEVHLNHRRGALEAMAEVF